MKALLYPNEINIVVIGDVMLDIYNYGDAVRISPEAPVPVFRSNERIYYLGGAANTFANLCNCGVNAYLLGLVGKDDSADFIRNMLFWNHIMEFSKKEKESSEIAIGDQLLYKKRIHLEVDPDYPTITKERIVARSQQIVRVDTEKPHDLNHAQIVRCLDKFEEIFQTNQFVDAIIISDYGKGMLCGDFFSGLQTEQYYKNTPIYIDPFPNGSEEDWYEDSFCITPNLKECEELGGERYLLNTQNINYVVRTEGEKGISLFSKNGIEDFHADTHAQTVYDVSGAGDTVIAVLAAAKSMGFSMQDAVMIANQAAGYVVSQMGTTAIDKETIKRIIKGQAYGNNYFQSGKRK